MPKAKSGFDVDIVNTAILLVSGGNFALVVRLIFMLGRMEEQHKSHNRRLTILENKHV